MPALVALIFVTAVWGVTFVQVKDAVAIYPLFAFLAVRFAIASATLALPAAKRVRGLGRSGIGGGAFLGLLLAAGYALQTAGLERTTVSSTAIALLVVPRSMPIVFAIPFSPFLVGLLRKSKP